ncbi:MAG: hypothetical protein K1X54_04995 [Flavobacteriales bacterium]|nr:hypothetical protein [Flavobacteriales bacterium]
MRATLTFLIAYLWTTLPCFSNFILLSCDTLIHDSLQVCGDSLMLQKITIMESELDEISEQLSSLSEYEKEENNDVKKKFVHFGLSLGYRWLTGNSTMENEFASVSPIDSTLRLTTLDRSSYLFSTSVIFDLNLGKLRSPITEEAFRAKRLKRQENINSKRMTKHKTSKDIRLYRTTAGRFFQKSIDRLCVVSNLNILDFSNGQKELAFNKSIEGGLGLGYRLNEVMYIGFNWEHVPTIQLYDDIKKFEGNKVLFNGEYLTSSTQLDTDNEDLFYKKNLSGWGIKMIICL